MRNNDNNNNYYYYDYCYCNWKIEHKQKQMTERSEGTDQPESHKEMMGFPSLSSVSNPVRTHKCFRLLVIASPVRLHQLRDAEEADGGLPVMMPSCSSSPWIRAGTWNPEKPVPDAKPMDEIDGWSAGCIR